jgi:hypothetical protein
MDVCRPNLRTFGVPEPSHMYGQHDQHVFFAPETYTAEPVKVQQAECISCTAERLGLSGTLVIPPLYVSLVLQIGLAPLDI